MKKYTPSDLLYYFAGEKKVLLYVTISGLIYNVGMTLSPWAASGRHRRCCASLRSTF